MLGDYLNFKDLEVWKRGHKYTIDVYKMTEKLDSNEKFALVQQMRRAAYSIPMNIAEGKASASEKQFLRYLGIARASAAECEYQLILCKDLFYITEKEFDVMNSEVISIQRMLSKLISVIRS